MPLSIDIHMYGPDEDDNVIGMAVEDLMVQRDNQILDILIGGTAVITTHETPRIRAPTVRETGRVSGRDRVRVRDELRQWKCRLIDSIGTFEGSTFTYRKPWCKIVYTFPLRLRFERRKIKQYPAMTCVDCGERLTHPQEWERIDPKERDSYLKWCGEQKTKPHMMCCYCIHKYFPELGRERSGGIGWGAGMVGTFIGRPVPRMEVATFQYEEI